MTAQNFETLRARVQALGYQLFIDNADDGDPRLYVHDPKIDKHVLVGVPADELEQWIETEEDVRNDTREVQAAAVADDFNGPNVAKSYERFLSLIVIAGMRDRFKAMDVRRDKGIEAAIAFLGECKLSNEAPHDDDAVDEPRNETTAEFRARITKECDADAAIHQAESVLWSCNGLAEILVQDQVRCNDAWVLAIGNAIAEQTERMIEFLDRPNGWSQGERA